jgi:hypothetical protein
MHNLSLGNAEDARQTPVEQREVDRLEAPAKNQGASSTLTKLQVEERIGDSTMFNLAIRSKLRGCDVVRLKVEDMARMAY